MSAHNDRIPDTVLGLVERLKRYRVRTCLTMHECVLCPYDITYGNSYHDGGYGRRAHVKCVANAIQEGATDMNKERG